MFGRLNPQINPKGNSDLSKQKMLALGKLDSEKTRILISILSSNVLVQATNDHMVQKSTMLEGKLIIIPALGN